MGNTKRRGEWDLDMLASDLSDLFDKYEYPIPDDTGPDEIRVALPAFLTALGVDATAWQPAADNPPTDDGLTLVVDQAPITVHTCNRRRPGKPLPYGRKAPAGECARCDEMHAGAPPRPAPEWIEKYRRLRDMGDARAEDIRQHFAPNGAHERGDCAPVCTAFDY